MHMYFVGNVNKFAQGGSNVIHKQSRTLEKEIKKQTNKHLQKNG